MNTKDKGCLAELAVAKFFSENGYVVSFPFGENAPYDLIVESPHRHLYRIQVRWVTPKNRILSVRVRAISKNYCRSLDFSRIDAMAIYDGRNVYLVPVDLVRERVSTLTLRLAPAANNQEDRVNYASDYQTTACVP